jgi:hypothetical protein
VAENKEVLKGTYNSEKKKKAMTTKKKQYRSPYIP